ncbi:hypothetical protein G5B47_02425 [Paenibacillus sp. 7124]|uniref:Uncharacterized protein n=1 Tax=Paenibacillus apii TaxID=1850370 RepID=A0A6M1PFB8_9BACL|nr:hypothetical protein [Paenibacillus apii]NGM81264.1 hypothetical protein [Paenibacillus apii]
MKPIRPTQDRSWLTRIERIGAWFLRIYLLVGVVSALIAWCLMPMTMPEFALWVAGAPSILIIVPIAWITGGIS